MTLTPNRKLPEPFNWIGWQLFGGTMVDSYNPRTGVTTFHTENGLLGRMLALLRRRSSESDNP